MSDGSGFFVLLGILAIASIFWRMNMALNHPEKYERLKQFEKDCSDRQWGWLRSPATKKAAMKGGGFLIRLFTRR